MAFVKGHKNKTRCHPNKHVLVVDDGQTARQALTFLLNDSGYQADSVASAEDALDWIGQGHVPSVVLVDVDLPGMSGVELVDRLSDSNPQIRSIFVTAFAEDEIATICRGRPVESIQKPVDFPELLKRIGLRPHLHA